MNMITVSHCVHDYRHLHFTFPISSYFEPSANSPVFMTEAKWFNPGHRGTRLNLNHVWVSTSIFNNRMKGTDCASTKSAASLRFSSVLITDLNSIHRWSENSPPWYACNRSQEIALYTSVPFIIQKTFYCRDHNQINSKKVNYLPQHHVGQRPSNIHFNLWRWEVERPCECSPSL